MTPLMLAAVRGGGAGLDSGEESGQGEGGTPADDVTAAVIAELVAQGAELDAAMDKTGETSLHLAAR